MKTDRHCLPMRVRSLMAAMISDDRALLAGLVAEGCACAGHRDCVLADACRAIHGAFESGGARAVA